MEKPVDRIRVGEDEYLTFCPLCQAKTNYFHLLGCTLESNPCYNCKAKFAMDCDCEFYNE